jgi:hypothetical protein
MLYEKERSFQLIADMYRLHRPDIRRAMRAATEALSAESGSREKAVAAYLEGLLDKSSASGTGVPPGNGEERTRLP